MVDMERTVNEGKDYIVITAKCVCCTSEDNEAYTIRELLDALNITLSDCEHAFENEQEQEQDFHCDGCEYLLPVDYEKCEYRCGHSLVCYDGVLRTDQCLAFDFKNEKSDEMEIS